MISIDEIAQSFPKYSNAAGNIQSVPLKIFKPRNKDEVISILHDARQKKITVRPIGSGHSFSEVIKEQFYMIHPQYLTECNTYEKYIRPGVLEKDRYLVKAEAGIRIKTLNKKLYKRGLALDNMGAFDWQTVSGALSTGTHGTGIHKPAFPDMVRAIVLILSNGETWHIEPSQGITDPDLFDSSTGIRLVQNDDIFYSVVLSFGAMGFIYEIIFEVGKKFWIKESRKVMDWDSELKPAIENGDFKNWVEKEYDFVSFRINPYYTKNKKTGKQQRLCSLALQKSFPGDPPLYQGWAAYTRNFLFTVLGNIGISTWVLMKLMNRKLSSIPNSINSGIKGSADKLFIGTSYKVLYQTGLSIRRQGISSEFAFDVDYQNLVKIIDRLAVHFKKLANTFSLYLSSHIPVRFVSTSKAYLSQCYLEPKMYIDLPTLDGVHGASQIMEYNQEFMVNELNGLPHWGKINHFLYSKPGYTDSHYPKAFIWRSIREKLDPIGMFYSDFVKKMGL